MQQALNFGILLGAILLVGLLIKALRSAVYGFLLTASLLISGMALANTLSGLLGYGAVFKVQSLGHLVMENFGGGILETTLMTAAITLLAGGAARSLGPALVSRVSNPVGASLLKMTVASLSGFANTTTASEMAIQVTHAESRKREESLILFAGVSNLGALLIPFSPSWSFYRKQMGAGGQGSGFAPEALQLWVPVIVFAVVMVIVMAWRSHKAHREVSTENPRSLLRLPPRRIRPMEVVFYLALMLPIAVLPALTSFTATHETPEHMLLYGILCGITLYLGMNLLADMSGATQPILKTEEGEECPLTRWPNAKIMPERPDAEELDLQATQIVALPVPGRIQGPWFWKRIPAKIEPAWKLGLIRLDSSWQSRRALFEQAIKNGALVGMLIFSVGIFRGALDMLMKGAPVQFPQIPFAVALPAAALVTLGVGWVLGTGWGSFAIVLSLLLPILQSLSVPQASLIVGLVIVASAAANSFSPQADNVQIVSHATHVPRQKISESVLSTCLIAVGVSALAALVLYFLPFAK